MIKKIFAMLTGFQEKKRPSHFEEQESIERANAEERRLQAMEHERERVRRQIETRQEPSEAEILGPSDSEEK